MNDPSLYKSNRMFMPNASSVYWGCGSQRRLSRFRYSPVKWRVAEWLCPEPLFLDSYSKSSVCSDFLCSFTGLTHTYSVTPILCNVSGWKKSADNSSVVSSPVQSGIGKQTKNTQFYYSFGIVKLMARELSSTRSELLIEWHERRRTEGRVPRADSTNKLWTNFMTIKPSSGFMGDLCPFFPLEILS